MLMPEVGGLRLISHLQVTKNREAVSGVIANMCNVLQYLSSTHMGSFRRGGHFLQA